MILEGRPGELDIRLARASLRGAMWETKCGVRLEAGIAVGPLQSSPKLNSSQHQFPVSNIGDRGAHTSWSLLIRPINSFNGWIKGPLFDVGARRLARGIAPRSAPKKSWLHPCGYLLLSQLLLREYRDEEKVFKG
jgi:hypothetical protein